MVLWSKALMIEPHKTKNESSSLTKTLGLSILYCCAHILLQRSIYQVPKLVRRGPCLPHVNVMGPFQSCPAPRTADIQRHQPPPTRTHVHTNKISSWPALRRHRRCTSRDGSRQCPPELGHMKNHILIHVVINVHLVSEIPHEQHLQRHHLAC